ncbi:MAG: ribonuclease BN, partial [Bacteroidota bacterium]
MGKKIITFLVESVVVIFIINLSKKIILPGFQKLPLYDVAIFFFRGMQKGALPMRASAVSFSFFLAMFPSIIFVFTLIPYIPIENFQE